MDSLTALYPLLLPALYGLSLIGCLFAALLGLALAVAPTPTLKANAFLNRWFNSRRLLEPLARPRYIEPVIYRHHRLVGLLLFLASLYILYTFNYRMGGGADRHLFANSGIVAAWLYDSLRALLLSGSLFALGLSVAVFLRPSCLKAPERCANQWFSIRRETVLDRWLAAHPRAFGLALLTIGAFFFCELLHIM